MEMNKIHKIQSGHFCAGIQYIIIYFIHAPTDGNFVKIGCVDEILDDVLFEYVT